MYLIFASTRNVVALIRLSTRTCSHPAVDMLRSQTAFTELRSGGLQIRCLHSQDAVRYGSKATSRHLCTSRASMRDDSTVPVVDDATVLPPPPTGSQYAWRKSWAGSGSASSTGSGGSGGTGGRSQARTKDWGRGPHSSLLFFLMYRIRMLLLYGAWVTVLYGAVRAVCDLSAKISQSVMYMVGKASRLGSTHLQGGSSTGANVAAAVAEDTGAAASSVAGASESQAAGTASAAAAAAAAEDEPAAEGSAASGGNSSRFASINAYLQDRPTARVFSDLMTCVIPLYLILLGSVVFFASM